MTQPPPLMEMITRLIALPSISSVTPALDMGNRNVIHQLARWLEDLGFGIHIQQVGDTPWKANLIARLGEGDDGLVLSGHTDTVPYDAGRWRFDPFTATVADGRLYGLGTADMKSFLALCIEAARDLGASSLHRPLTIIATADEESTMIGAKHLASAGERPGRYCIIGEPTGLRPVRQHKGILMEGIRLRGRAGHSSNPAAGNNAIDGMVQVMEALMGYRRDLADRYRNTSFEVPVPTLNLGHIHGGDNPNRICGECELHIDLRPLPGMDLAEVRGEIQSRVRDIAQDRGLGVEFIPLFEGAPAMETAADAAIVRAAEKLTGCHASAVAFATEGPYYNGLGTDTVILGPGSITQAHQPDEYIELSQLQPTVELLRTLIEMFCVTPENR